MILEKLSALGFIAKTTGLLAFLAPGMALRPFAPEAKAWPVDEVGRSPGQLAARSAADADAAAWSFAGTCDDDAALMGDARSAAERICALHVVAGIEIAAIESSLDQLRADLASVALNS